MFRFRINHDKCIQGIHWLAVHKPGVTQYYIGKIFFMADRKHLKDWGRPISGDRYVAMEHGPVPSTIYDLVKDTGGEPDEIADELNHRVNIISQGNKRCVYPRDGDFDYPALSESDKEYLSEAVRRYSRMSFPQLKRLSHADRAYDEAWARPGLNNEMDVSLWLADEEGGEQAIKQLEESSWIEKPRARFRRGPQAA